MGEFLYDPLEEPDLFNAVSLNSRFTTGANSAQGAVNDLTENAPAPGAFNNEHLPTLVHFSGGQNVGSAGAGSHTYTHLAGATNNDNIPVDWTVINSDGDAGTGTDLEVDFGALFNLSGTTVQGVLVMADLQIRRFYDAGSYTYNHEAVFMIQVFDGASWVNIPRTLRWALQGIRSGSAAETAQRDQLIKVPIRTLIRADDIGNNTIEKVRVVVSIGNGNTSNTETVELWWCQLSALVLQSTRT